MPAFISHSFKDEAVYSAVCLAVDAAGIKRWDPAMMSPGESLADQLRNAIRECEVCAFIATRRSIESPWCLAELGAFWGADKKVLLFMADPDLADSMLPPQFKGNLRVSTAQELIKALAATTEEHDKAIARAKAEAPYEFFETSGNYGKEKDWQTLIQGAEKNFDIMGVALVHWRKTPGFKETVLAKAGAGCSVRILLMHEDNKVLRGLLYDDGDLHSVVHDIKESHAYYSSLAAKESNVEVRQIRHGIPHFFLTRTDQLAVIIQYLSSETWGSGPTWRCPAQSKLFSVAVREFEHLWTLGTAGDTGTRGTAALSPDSNASGNENETAPNTPADA
ncbi:MAG TPA: toll/interleukin-1 receptor domain-containing protein [Thermoanaerobaculia bacterium]|nr:toll/interleukin-1 receptor domain-containing protein [Thermoanaerobaculia bacterium]